MGCRESGAADGDDASEAKPALWQSERSQHVFYFVQEFGKTHRLTSRRAGIVGLGSGGRMAMPHAAQLIPRIDALLVVHQYQVGRIKTVVTVDLNKEIRPDVQARLEKGGALVKHSQSANVGPILGLVV